MGSDPFYITTPIYYVNDRPHIGHAYTTIACDALARFMRLDGRSVKFLTGTDEHGQKVEKSAAAAGIQPKDFVDEVSTHFRDLTGLLNISNDDFIRTTEPRHIKTAQAVWKKLQENGDIYLGSYSGWYSVRDEAYYAESELVEGKAPTGAPVEWVEEPSYFFRLSRWQEPLLKFYAQNPDFIAPESRRNEVIRFVEGGLLDLSVSRTTFRWGIPVPGDDKHIMYVWLDALVNYLTAVGYPDESGELSAFWPSVMHMVGKDILRFHAVYWPAFLMSAGITPPKRVFAHGWWTIEGEKMSKSLGNVVAPGDLVRDFGLDQTRYFLLREVPFGNDGNFSREALIGRANSELANTIGNLVQRTLSFIHKQCEGKLPVAKVNSTHYAAVLDDVRAHMRVQAFHKALEVIIGLANAANEKIDKRAPWSLKKQGTPEALAEMHQVLAELAEDIRVIALLLQPFIPGSAALMLDQLGVPPERRSFAFITEPLPSGQLIEQPQGVFPRIIVNG